MEEIGAGAFRGLLLKRIHVDSELKKVGKGAFEKKYVFYLEGSKRERRALKRIIKKAGGRGKFRRG